MKTGRCVLCGRTIRRGQRYETSVDGPRGSGIAHRVCPELRLVEDGERALPEPPPELNLTLRPGPPEAS